MSIEILDTTDKSGTIKSVLDACQSIVVAHLAQLDTPIQDMSDNEIQTLIEKLDTYVAFERLKSENILGEVVMINGFGMVVVTDQITGARHQSRVIRDGMNLKGKIESFDVDFSVSLKALQDQDSTKEPIMNELAVYVYMSNAHLTSDLNTGVITTEDLSMYDVAVPLSHYLSVSAI